MRKLALGAALLALAGCNSTGQSDWSNYYRLMRDSFHASFGDGGVTREQAAAVPYASIGVRSNGNPELLLVLATDNDGDLLWTSASRIVLLTRQGRVVRTVGLGHDLSGQTPGSAGLPPPAAALRGPFSSTRVADFSDIGMFGVSLSCNARAAGPEIIRILGQAISTVRVDEACRNTNQRWSFVDNFWVDPQNGFVWRARQHLHPRGGVVETEILRPPG